MAGIYRILYQVKRRLSRHARHSFCQVEAEGNGSTSFGKRKKLKSLHHDLGSTMILIGTILPHSQMLQSQMPRKLNFTKISITWDVLRSRQITITSSMLRMAI